MFNFQTNMIDYRTKVFVVDDLNFHLVSIRERLKEHYDVYTTGSAEGLFELLGQLIPDIILLDINMPEVDGFETLKRLKSNIYYENIPVIFLTSKSDPKSILKGIKFGAVDYVCKPFTDAHLVECIDNQVNPQKRNANKPVILAVDDNPSELKTLYQFLHQQYNIYTLPESDKISDLLEMITPDLFLLDCQMPVLNGFDLVPIIRKMPQYEITPIIFITSAGSIDNISVAMHLGAADFIVKPVDRDILDEKVANQLKGYMIRRHLRNAQV